MTDLLVTTLDDGVATLTLNRPNAINSLNLEMLQAASEILTSWAHDDSVREVVLRGEGTRGFSAGADVRELSQAVSDNESWLRFLEVEYLLDLIVAQFPKHITAHLNGITMGGGLGLTVNADRRIVDSSTLMAMPETKIGFFPDAGVMYWLARAGALGTHMALTSGTIGGGDALRINLAGESADGDLPAPLSEAAWVQECYTGDDPVEIAHRLEEHPDPAAQQAGRELRARSPFSVHVAAGAAAGRHPRPERGAAPGPATRGAHDPRRLRRGRASAPDRQGQPARLALRHPGGRAHPGRRRGLLLLTEKPSRGTAAAFP